MASLTAKKSIKTKRQPTKWEKTFATDVTGEKLISKIYDSTSINGAGALG